jgi:hypothetical protein
MGILYDILQFSIVTALDCALRPSWQTLLQSAPVFPLLHDEFADLEVLLD